MTVTVTLDQVLHLAPNARSSYRDAFQNGQAVFDRHGISQTPLRVAHFMAQILHESGGLAIQFENLNYSAGRLPKVWPSRFKPSGPLDPSAYANNPQKLANEVYGGRMGNKNPGDGWRFIGRGLMQTTGRYNYEKLAQTMGMLVDDLPSWIETKEGAAESAAFYWAANGCNELADADALDKCRQRINGGLIGIVDVRERYIKALGLLT